MADVNERFDRIEQALTGVNEQLGTLSERITQLGEGLGGRITGLDEDMSGRITGLDEDMSGRIARLDEDMSGRIARLDEHLRGRLDGLDERLEHVAKGIEPLKDLRDFVQRVADDHERRITELEKRTAGQDGSPREAGA